MVADSFGDNNFALLRKCVFLEYFQNSLGK
jgi:hypothetical protein